MQTVRSEGFSAAAGKIAALYTVQSTGFMPPVHHMYKSTTALNSIEMSSPLIIFVVTTCYSQRYSSYLLFPGFCYLRIEIKQKLIDISLQFIGNLESRCRLYSQMLLKDNLFSEMDRFLKLEPDLAITTLFYYTPSTFRIGHGCTSYNFHYCSKAKKFNKDFFFLVNLMYIWVYTY